MTVLKRRNNEFFIAAAFLLLSLTFSTVLFNSLDEHYTHLIQERSNIGGSGTFSGARILSILALNSIALLGFSLRQSSQILLVIATVGILFAFRSMLESCSRLPRSRASLLAPAILIPMVWNYVILSGILFPEDIPALLLFTLGLAFLFRDKRRYFHIVFLLAILNRESSVFLLPAMFLIQVGKRNLLKLTGHILALVCVCVCETPPDAFLRWRSECPSLS